ncbi:hypothetical protein MZO42_04060 [Sphingomonas psychrotolerans]|uniref:Uncharacterized protein n=1 Tax=Sphingomonas psychrotolerans TaxID=1327635 RepID=A0ABU3N266_9SPHN|nr:hypothetical protein [Sphingomonas psychrotolerans]
MWVFVGLACTELVVVHFLVALWDWRVALVLSLVSLVSVLWLIGVIRSFRRLPVVIGEGRVRLRAGRLKTIDVPLDQVAEIRTQWPGEDLKTREALNLALIAWPNIVIELRTPRPGRRAIRRIGHRFDDPAAFQTALAAATQAEEGGGL